MEAGREGGMQFATSSKLQRASKLQNKTSDPRGQKGDKAKYFSVLVLFAGVSGEIWPFLGFTARLRKKEKQGLTKGVFLGPQASVL
jgi:hypothetical protein